MFTDKVALITGASRGIGKAIAIELAQKGATVVINYAKNEEQANQVAQIIKESTTKQPSLCQFNVADLSAVEKAVSGIIGEHGCLDILINNAGVVRNSLLMRLQPEDLDAQININLKGAIYCAKASVRAMIKQKWGRIINVSSIVGEIGNVGQSAYAASKAGLLGFTKSLAKELASRQITVNAVTPGYIETDMTQKLAGEAKKKLLKGIPLGVIGRPSDIANAVSFLSSNGASYITGQTLAVNGGLNM